MRSLLSLVHSVSKSLLLLNDLCRVLPGSAERYQGLNSDMLNRSSLTQRWLQTLFLVAISSFFLTGCGGGAPAGPPTDDAGIIESFVTELPDRATQPKLWEEAFVAGSAPADAKPYQMIQVEPQEVSVDENKATVMVTITSGATPAEGEPVEWTLEKTGSDWKFSSAPLKVISQ